VLKQNKLRYYKSYYFEQKHLLTRSSIYLQLETAPLSNHPVMFGINMWRSPEQVQQHRLQQLETAATSLAQQVETRLFQ